LPGEFLRQYWPAQTPVKTGEIPSVWALGSGSVLGGFTPHLRNSNLLLRAEKWASLAEILADKLYPAEALKTAWQAHLITLDHEGAGLRRERELAALLGDRIREESLQAIASHVRIPQEADIALVVFNALSWKRTETVEKEVFLVGDAMAFTTRPYHKLELVDSEGHSVPFEIYEKQSTIVRSVKVRFRAEDVPPLGWTTYFLRPAETDRARTYPAPQEARGDIGIENASVEVKFTPAARSFLLAARPGGEPVELVYYHQPQIKSPEPGFFRDKDSGSPILPTWRHVGRGENLAGPYLQAEGEIEGVELKVQIQLDGGSPVAVHETLRGQARGKLKLVRKLEFPSGGKFVYGVPFGVQPFDNVMAQAGPEEKGSNDELPRDDWYHTREFDGWAAWRARGRQVTVASEARGGRFDDRSLKTTLFYSAEAGPLFGDAAVYPDPHALTTRMLVSFATQAHAAPRLGWEFLNPLEIMISVGYLSGTLAPTYAGVENGSGVILTTFKKAEDGQGWIARAYAAEAAAAWPRLFTEREWRVRPADLAEKRVDGEASAPLRPFEIRTVRMQPAKAAQAAPATSSANSAR
jgi:alpha-mannosidase